MNETLLIGCGNLGCSIIEAFLRKKKKISVVEQNRKIVNLLEKKRTN